MCCPVMPNKSVGTTEGFLATWALDVDRFHMTSEMPLEIRETRLGRAFRLGLFALLPNIDQPGRGDLGVLVVPLTILDRTHEIILVYPAEVDMNLAVTWRRMLTSGGVG